MNPWLDYSLILLTYVGYLTVSLSVVGMFSTLFTFVCIGVLIVLTFIAGKSGNSFRPGVDLKFSALVGAVLWLDGSIELMHAREICEFS